MQVADIRRHPAWFGSVMGTSVLALALLGWRDAVGLSADDPAGAVLGGLAWLAVLTASLLALAFVPRYGTRLARSRREELRTELADPAAGALLATVPGGLLVLAVAWPRVGSTALPALQWQSAWILGALLALAGTVLTIGMGLAWTTAIADSSEPALEKVNGGWFIPPVVNVLIPLALVAPMREGPAEWSTTLWLTGLWFWGAGFLLFLAVLALLVARMAIGSRQPVMMAPSQWIPLAPAGVAGVALVQLVAAAAERGIVGAGGVSIAVVVAALLAGFGIWWALFAGTSLLRYRRSGPVPFHPGWWGFTFPLGAMTVSLALQAVRTESALATALATVFLAALLIAWIAAARGSLRATASARRLRSSATPA